MALNTLFLEVYIAILCINGGILIVDGAISTPLKSPFDITPNVTAATQPNIFNATDSSGTLTENITSNVINNTDSSILDPVADFVFFPLQVIWNFIQLLTGGFIFENLTIFGFPTTFVFVMQGIIGILLVITIIYYFTGR